MSCETKLWRFCQVSCPWIAQWILKPWTHANLLKFVGCPLMLTFFFTNTWISLKLPTMGFTRWERWGLGESFSWWPCFVFTIMSLIVEVEILFDMIGGLELGTLAGLWVQAHCYCIWVEFLLRLGFKSLAMFEPCSVHVVYVCVTSYWVVCLMLKF